jgi:hypothetical protein
MLLPLPLRTVLAAILSLSVLAGCFDLEQTLSIDRERVDYAVEVRMDARLAAINQRQDGRRNFCEPVELPAQAIARGVKTETIERTINGDLSCLIRISGPLDAFLLALTQTKTSPVGALSITRIDGSTLRLENRLDASSSQTGGRGASSGLESSFAEGMFAGRSFRWKLTAPQVIASNGTIAPDTRSVEWSVPVAAAFRETQTFHATFRVELGLQDRIRIWFIEQWRAIRQVLRQLLADR